MIRGTRSSGNGRSSPPWAKVTPRSVNDPGQLVGAEAQIGRTERLQGGEHGRRTSAAARPAAANISSQAAPSA